MTWIPGIKQISQIGNDMYIQGAFPQAGIATTEVDLLADPADTRLLAGRDPVLEEISVGMSGVETDLKTQSGAAPLHITDAMQGMLRYLETNIKPVQDLHGYANPWPGGCSSNKLNPDTVTSGYKFTTTNGTPVPIANYTVSDYIPVTAGESYYFINVERAFNGAAGWWYDSSKADISDFTVAGGSDHATSGAKTAPEGAAYVRINWYGDVQAAVNYPATVTTWSPYSNICPIQGWAGCNVYVSPTTNQADATVYPCTWQDDAGTVYGGMIDLISGWMTVTHCLVTFDGTETWTYAAGDAGHWRFAYRPDISVKQSVTADTISNQYAARTPAETYTGNIGISQNTNDSAIFICDERFATASDLQTFLAGQYSAGTPVQALYPLDTNEYYQVPGNQILTQEGTNYIWTDCGDTITAAYVAVK